MMHERVQEKADVARELKAAKQVNVEMLKQMADLRALMLQSSSQRQEESDLVAGPSGSNAGNVIVD
eukprot:2451183-Pleurochrysis_carterae.AAC.1